MNINGTETWPINVNVYIDGKQADYGNVNWNYTVNNGIIPYGTGLIINGATSNVSIQYMWYPVPEPANQSTGSSLPTTINFTRKLLSTLYTNSAIASGIIVPAAVFSNRRRLESIINKRIKRKS